MLDHVDLANQVGDGHIGSGQLLVVTLAPGDPLDRRLFALGRDQVTSIFRYWCEGVVVYFRAGDARNEFIEQRDELAEDAGLGLAAQPQEEHVVFGEDRVLDLRQDGLLVAQDVGKQGFAGLEPGDQVPPHLVFYRLNPVAAGHQLAQGTGPIRHHR